MRKQKTYQFIVFSHELMEDELAGAGDLHGLGEHQEYDDYYIVNAENEDAAFNKFLEYMYTEERQETFFFKSLVNDLVKNMVYEIFDDKNIKTEDLNFLTELSKNINNEFWDVKDKSNKNRNDDEIIEEISGKIDEREFACHIEEQSVKYLWLNYTAKGRFGILKAKEIE